MTFYTPFTRAPNITQVHGHSRDPFNLEVTSQDIPGVKSTDSGPWAGIPSQPNMWNPPLGGTGYVYNPFPMRIRPPLDLDSGTAIQSLSPAGLPLGISNTVLCSPTCHGEPPRDTLAFSHGNEDNLQRQLHSRTDNIYGKRLDFSQLLLAVHISNLFNYLRNDLINARPLTISRNR